MRQRCAADARVRDVCVRAEADCARAFYYASSDRGREQRFVDGVYMLRVADAASCLRFAMT